MKIYFAGPDVFRPDALAFFEFVSTYAKIAGHVPLIPVDPSLDGDQAIFENNLRLIDECDVIVANLTPFRGTEPDSGTVWECGYGRKPVIAYMKNDTYTVKQRSINYWDQLGIYVSDEQEVHPDGMITEGFKLRLNLMLAKSVKLITRDVWSAIDAVRELK